MATIRKAHVANSNETADFSRSVAVEPACLSGALRDALKRLSQPASAQTLLVTDAGRGDVERQIASQWLARRFGEPVDPERIIVTNGTQSAVLLLVRSLVSDSKMLSSEELTFGSLAGLLGFLNVGARPVMIDGEGVVPDAFDDVCKNNRIGALYCNPTFHNPTAVVMSPTRRLELAEVARKHRVPIIEDDPIAPLYPWAVEPIARLAPDVTWYVSGLTKCVSYGMRIGFIVAPDAVSARSLSEEFRRGSFWVAAPLTISIWKELVESGDAASIANAIADENIFRRALACKVIAAPPSPPGSPHLWLHLPPRWTVDAFESAAALRGVTLRTGRHFRIDAAETYPAVRLSLTSPKTTTELKYGLAQVADLLATPS